MSDQFDLFDARAAKDEGMTRVEQHAAPGYLDYMLTQVRLTCLEMPTFTSDDVQERAALDPHAPTTHDLRAFGPVMTRAARLNYCRKANCAPLPSVRTTLHASPRAVWESLLYREG